MRRKLALWLCPELKGELDDLHGQLFSLRIERMQNVVDRWMEDPRVRAVIRHQP